MRTHDIMFLDNFINIFDAYVFKCRLKVDSDDDDVTNDGRLFHVRAAATGKA